MLLKLLYSIIIIYKDLDRLISLIDGKDFLIIKNRRLFEQLEQIAKDEKAKQ